MAGIPKRRKGERRQSYQMRVVDAEYTRRNENAIDFLEKLSQKIRDIHEKAENDLFAELVRYYRAKPGTKYDITARKKK
jgi:predicted RNA-binding protein with PIN domain